LLLAGGLTVGYQTCDQEVTGWTPTLYGLFCADVSLTFIYSMGGNFSPPDHFYRDISGTAKDEDMSIRDYS